jgi:hypothetical protein
MSERVASVLRGMPRRCPWRIERSVFIPAPPRSGSTLPFERRRDRFERLVRRPRMRCPDKTTSTCFRLDPDIVRYPKRPHPSRTTQVEAVFPKVSTPANRSGY